MSVLIWPHQSTSISPCWPQVERTEDQSTWFPCAREWGWGGGGSAARRSAGPSLWAQPPYPKLKPGNLELGTRTRTPEPDARMPAEQVVAAPAARVLHVQRSFQGRRAFGTAGRESATSDQPPQAGKTEQDGEIKDSAIPSAKEGTRERDRWGNTKH